MTDWASGYVTDLGYTHGFCRELTPALLNLALLLCGVRPPVQPDAAFSSCELGCGQGFTANLLAAANPAGDFWAIDINPSHIAGARRLSQAAGLANIRFLDHSFDQFLDADTPPFDYITLHGVWSWVSPENRQRIVAIIDRKLKIGGAVHVSYNCLPGWAALMPLRRLLVDHDAAGTGPTTRRVERALAFAARLQGHAGYLAATPTASARLDRLRDQSTRYIAHEYFNRDWAPEYHADVVRMLSAARLSYVGSGHLAEHAGAGALPPGGGALLAGIDDPVYRETVRDFLTNQPFRRDLFVRGPLPLSPTEQAEELGAIRFALTTPRQFVPMTVTLPSGTTVTLDQTIAQPVLAALAGGPQTYAALADGSREPARLHETLMLLAGSGHVMPAAGAPDTTMPDMAARRTITDRLNAAILDRARHADELQALASPVLGSGIAADRLEQLFLLARHRAAEPVDFAWRVLNALGQRVVRDGRVLETPEDNREELADRLRMFERRRLPLLHQLGVI